MEDVGVLGGGVVAPDGHVTDVIDSLSGLAGKLRFGAVVIQTSQGGEVVVRDVDRVGSSDEGVGVSGVTGDENADVVGGDVVEGLALGGEDSPVLGEQIGTLHTRLAGHGADEEGGVNSVKDLLRIVTDLDIHEIAEGAVVKLHDDALKGFEGRGDLEKAKLDRSVSEQRTGSNAEQQAVANLASSSGDGNLDWGLGHGSLLESPR